jgi:hypothetical protein
MQSGYFAVRSSTFISNNARISAHRFPHAIGPTISMVLWEWSHTETGQPYPLQHCSWNCVLRIVQNFPDSFETGDICSMIHYIDLFYLNGSLMFLFNEIFDEHQTSHCSISITNQSNQCFFITIFWDESFHNLMTWIPPINKKNNINQWTNFWTPTHEHLITSQLSLSHCHCL